MSQGIVILADDFQNPAASARNYRAAAGERLGHGQSERFRCDACMYDDVERAHGRGAIADKTGESDPLLETQRASHLPQFVKRILAARRAINRAADNISANWFRAQQAKRAQKNLVAFP